MESRQLVARPVLQSSRRKSVKGGIIAREREKKCHCRDYWRMPKNTAPPPPPPPTPCLPAQFFLDFICEALDSRKKIVSQNKTKSGGRPEPFAAWRNRLSRKHFFVVVLFGFGYPLPMWWCWPFTADGNLRDSLSPGQTLKAKSASPFSSLFSTCEEPSGPPVASGRETLAWLIRHREGRTRNRLLQPTPEGCVSVSTGFKHATDTPADIGNIYSK